MDIIDAHIHFRPYEGFDRLAIQAGHENSEEYLRGFYRERGIRRAIVMGNRSAEAKDHSYPDFMSYCVGLDSTLLAGVSLADCLGGAEENLRRKECVGIKLYPGYCPKYVYDPEFFPFYELAEAYGKPVAIHTGSTAGSMGELRYCHPLTLDRVAVLFPRVQFVMCHFGNPFVTEAAAVIGKNPNVSADLSGMLEGKPHMPALFEEYSGYVEHLRTWIRYLGAYDRLMYATDWPLANIDCYIEFVAALVPERHHEAVFFNNANRIYRLGL